MSRPGQQVPWLPILAIGICLAASLPAATFTVTKVTDTNDGTCDADCSLREAINAANTSDGADTVTLGAGQTYVLSLGPADPDRAPVLATGDLDITGALTIQGNASSINGGGIDRVIDIHNGVPVTIGSLTVYGGSLTGFLAAGGGIAAYGIWDPASATSMLTSLTLNNVTVSGNSAANGAGIVCVLCALTINDSAIVSNTASATGGGIEMVGNASTLAVTRSTLASNAGSEAGGGVAILFGTGTANLSLNRIVGNVTAAGSNAIYNNTASLTIENNWWGCNGGPGVAASGCTAAPNGVAGPATWTRHLVMNVSPSRSRMAIGSTAIVTADLTVNSLGQSTTGGGTVPNGISAAFSGTRGTFAEAVTPTSNGKATNLFTASGPNGLATMSVTIDGQTVGTSIWIANPFTDDPLVAGVTLVRAVHFNELQTRINAARSARGIGAYAFSPVGVGTVVQATHIAQLRAAVADLYVTPPTYTDNPLSVGTPIRAAHVEQLRTAVVAVE
jgi:CSLREA domain-containing protein